MVTSSTATVLASVKRAAPLKTRTPSPTKRWRVAFGARAAMTSRIFAVTVGKSTLVRPDFTPKRAPLRTACARSAAAIRARTDARPEVLTLSSPKPPVSISTAGTPKEAAAAATASPPASAPITQMSGVSGSAIGRPATPPAARICSQPRHRLLLVKQLLAKHISASPRSLSRHIYSISLYPEKQRLEQQAGRVAVGADRRLRSVRHVTLTSGKGSRITPRLSRAGARN